MKDKVLLILEEALLIDILKTIFGQIGYEIDVIDSPREAVDKIVKEHYEIIVIGRNKGTVVKNKLADILYEKSKNRKPHIIIIKEPGDMIPNVNHISIVNYPTFHKAILNSIPASSERSIKIHNLLKNSDFNIDNFIKNKDYKDVNVAEFFKNIKGNIKFEFLSEDKKIVGFVMNGELYILYSDIDDPYDIFLIKNPKVATTYIDIAEFLSLQIDNNVFKINVKDFIIKSLNKVYDQNLLLSLLPSGDKIVVLKAPVYILKQCDFVESNFKIEWLESKSGEITLREMSHQSGEYSVNKLRAVVAMFILNMIELKDDKTNTDSKFDVKIKKSFLKKIMDKIRGL